MRSRYQCGLDTETLPAKDIIRTQPTERFANFRNVSIMLAGSAGKVLLNGSDAMIGGNHDLMLAHVPDPYVSSWSVLQTALLAALELVIWTELISRNDTGARVS